MNIKDAISHANNVVNPADAEALKTMIYELRNKNLELNAQFKECQMQLKIAEGWSETKKDYKESHTSGRAVVYVCLRESVSGIFYCPACFAQKIIVPMSKLTKGIARQINYSMATEREHFCPSCKQVYQIK